MRIAVCDDNAIDRDIACEMLRGYFADRRPLPEIISYGDGIVMIDDIRDGAWYDVIFLDILMDNMIGIEVAHRLREMNYGGEIVFITSSSDFAIEGYDVNATGYILKPLDSEKLGAVLQRVMRTIKEETYAVRRRSSMVRVPLSEILFVESSNNKCILHRTDGVKYTIYKRLDEIESELTSCRFLRCSQSYIVNMDYIVEVGRSFRLTSGDIVLIRQRSLKAIQKAYYDYVGMKNDAEAAVNTR